ncbi:MAG: hypothetical protein RIQ56_900 [Candidatus Parcubacteria bacterium]|jgi:predicted NBD/HSP70 family sugar kinase
MKSSSIIGIDLGGTKCAVSRYAAATMNEETSNHLMTNASEGLPSVLDRVITEAKKLRTKETTGVGVGIAGLVNDRTGMLLRAPNIAMSENVDVKKIVEQELQLPVTVDNDVHCFTLAEARYGAGKGHSVVIGITMGTGVGGGIVIDGRIYHGAHGFAAELGHMLLQPGNPPYPTSDKRGEVEQFLSGTAMGKRCEAAKRPEDYLEGEVCEWMRPEIFKEVAWLCVNLTHLLDPSIIIFGGSSGKALKPHFKDIEKEFKHWSLPGLPIPELAVSTLEKPGALGAALLATI